PAPPLFPYTTLFRSRSLAPWLLPYLKDRPVVLTRYPDGINGKSFYQKDAPGFVPDWIQTIPIWSEDTQRDIDYFVCNDVESLVRSEEHTSELQSRSD